MSLDRRSLKAQAREKLRSATPRPILEGLLFVLVVGILWGISAALLWSHVDQSALDTYFQYVQNMVNTADEHFDYNAGILALSDYLNNNLMTPVPAVDNALLFVLNLLRDVVAVGFSLFCLNTLRQSGANLWNLLDGFGRILPLLLLLLVRDLLVQFGLYLFIIPGLILAYRYRLSIYLLLDNPALNAFQCLALSGRIMRGRKRSLFMLDLSFLGWAFLATLPLSIGSSFGLSGTVLGALGSAAILVWLLPYYELSCVGFYEAVKTPIESIPPSLPSV